MEAHQALNDLEFETRFAACELDPSLFSHEAHLRLAWIHLRRYGIELALERVPLQLQRFVVHAGAGDKYNATVTIAAIKAVHHFLRKSKSSNFPDFIAEFPRLKHNFKELMGCHYAGDIFTSETAKSKYFEPDLLPFD